MEIRLRIKLGTFWDMHDRPRILCTVDRRDIPKLTRHVSHMLPALKFAEIYREVNKPIIVQWPEPINRHYYWDGTGKTCVDMCMRATLRTTLWGVRAGDRVAYHLDSLRQARIIPGNRFNDETSFYLRKMTGENEGSMPGQAMLLKFLGWLRRLWLRK